jgi:serine/threonine-protein kinase
MSDDARTFRLPRVSPDGNRIVVEVRAQSGEVDLWLFDRRTETLTRFTSDGASTDPIWSPDGTRIAYARGRGLGGADVVWQRADGGDVADTIVGGPGSQWPWTWTPDGKTMVYDEGPIGQPIRIMATRVAGDSAPRVLASASQYTNRLASLSPDGRWLAYTSNESGRIEVYVRPFHGSGGKVQISTDGGDQPLWSRGGHELYYRDGTKFVAAAIRTTPEIVISSRTHLFDDRFQMSNATNYDVLADGRFIMLQSATESVAQMFVIVNWKPPVAK